MNNRLHYLRALLAFTLIFSCSYAQSQRIAHVSFDQPSSYTFRIDHVTDAKRQMSGIAEITQSSDGLIWMAGTEEIIRYDGYDLVFYRTPMTEPDAKALNFYRRILVDHAGIVWTATRAPGLKSFDPKTERFARYLPDSSNPQKLSDPYVTALYEDRNGVLWIGTRTVLNSLDKKRGLFCQFADDTSETVSTCTHLVSCILEDRHGTLWIGTTSGLSRFDRNSNRFIRVGSVKGRSLRLPSDTVTALCEDDNGIIWIGLTNGLVRFEPSTGSSLLCSSNPDDPQSPSVGWVLSLARDGFGNIWVASREGGLRLLEPSTRRCVHFRSDPTDPNTILNDLVSRVYAEKPIGRTAAHSASPRQPAAVMWLHYPEVGVTRIVVRKNHFLNIRSSLLGLEENRSGVLWSSIQAHDGTIWAGCQLSTGKGLQNVDLRSQRLIRYVYDKNNVHSLASNAVKQVLEDRNHTLWVVNGGRLQRFEPGSKNFETIALPAGVGSIAEGQDGTLWLALMSKEGYVSAGKFDPSSDSCITYPRPQESLIPPKDQSPLSIYEDTKGFVWIGTFNGGAYRFDKQAHAYRRFRGSEADSGALRTDAVSCFAEDSSGTLWVGTHIGLYRYDRTSEQFESIPHPVYTTTSFARFFIRGMVSDDRGCLWIASDPTLSRFDISRRMFRDFGPDEGLEVSRLGAIQFDREKRSMCVGAMNGLALFHPDSLIENSRVPTVLLTSFKVHEKQVSLAAPLTATERIEIPYSDNFISFTFSAVDFVNPSKNLYAHMMEGFDEDWVQTGTRRYASYTNLEPGSYIFRVKGSNSDGVWNETGTSVRLVVTPPWYRSTPAYVAYVVFFICTLYLLERYYRKRLSLRHEMQMRDFESKKLREIDQIKSRFFANISHEFRTPLTLILGPLDRIQSSLREHDMQEDVSAMRRSAQKLLQLINRLLDLSKVDAGQMPLCARKTDFIVFLQMHISSFLPFAERRGIGLKFEPCADPIEVTIDREKIEEVISNLLSNALKFTPRGGEVTLSARISTEAASAGSIQSPAHQCVSVAVTDTGIGIPPDELPKVFDRFHQVDNIRHQQRGGTGIGLALAKELVEMHNGSIAATSVVGEGSTFTFTLPMGQDHLRPDQIFEDDQGASVARHPKEVEGMEEDVTPGFLKHPGPDHKKPLVLLIEDNADVRRFIRSILDHEYRIEEAANGEAGLTIAAEELPDIVISDVMMPRMDGLELCKRLKTDERTSHIPVILLTAKASMDSKLEGLAIGADDYIVKPFEASELLARARNLIENRLKLREKYRHSIALGTPDLPASSADERFLKKAITAVERHLSEAGYETATLAYELCMSRMNLNRKLHALTGHSTHAFIRTLRLHRAAQLLRQRSGTVSEIAFDVGFSSVSHFAKAFHEQFGEFPSEIGEHTDGRTQS